MPERSKENNIGMKLGLRSSLCQLIIQILNSGVVTNKKLLECDESELRHIFLNNGDKLIGFRKIVTNDNDEDINIFDSTIVSSNTTDIAFEEVKNIRELKFPIFGIFKRKDLPVLSQGKVLTVYYYSQQNIQDNFQLFFMNYYQRLCSRLKRDSFYN
jgi:hypothetical protein